MKNRFMYTVRFKNRVTTMSAEVTVQYCDGAEDAQHAVTIAAWRMALYASPDAKTADELWECIEVSQYSPETGATYPKFDDPFALALSVVR